MEVGSRLRVANQKLRLLQVSPTISILQEKLKFNRSDCLTMYTRMMKQRAEPMVVNPANVNQPDDSLTTTCAESTPSIATTLIPAQISTTDAQTTIKELNYTIEKLNEEARIYRESNKDMDRQQSKISTLEAKCKRLISRKNDLRFTLSNLKRDMATAKTEAVGDKCQSIILLPIYTLILPINALQNSSSP